MRSCAGAAAFAVIEPAAYRHAGPAVAPDPWEHRQMPEALQPTQDPGWVPSYEDYNLLDGRAKEARWHWRTGSWASGPLAPSAEAQLGIVAGIEKGAAATSPLLFYVQHPTAIALAPVADGLRGSTMGCGPWDDGLRRWRHLKRGMGGHDWDPGSARPK